MLFYRNAAMSLSTFLYFISKMFNNIRVQEVFHVYLNKFENAVTPLFLVIFGNN